MNKAKIYTIISFLFLLTALTFFIPKNDYLSEYLDLQGAKTDIKNDDLYEMSFLSTDSKFKSKNFPISALVSIPKYKDEFLKYETIRKYIADVNEKIEFSSFVFLLVSLVGLLSAVIVLLYRRKTIVLILGIVITSALVWYDVRLTSALNALGIINEDILRETLVNIGYAEDVSLETGMASFIKPFLVTYQWGVAETVQHILVVLVFTFLAIIFVIDIKNKSKEKLNVKENIIEIKKSVKLTIEEMKKNLFSYYMLLPATIIVLLIIIYPFLYNLQISFSNLSLKRFLSFIQGNKLYYNGIENYFTIFADPLFWQVLARTLVWTVVNIIFHVTGGVFLALLLNRDMKLKPFYQMMLIIPWAIPQFIAVLVWRGMFNTDYGTVNILIGKVVEGLHLQSLLGLLNIPYPIPWLTDPFWLFTGALITNIWLGIPFMMLIALGGLQSIPETYYEAAEIDGATAWDKIWNITIPMLKPVMTPAIVLGVVWTFNNLNVIYLLSTDTLTGKVDILVTYVYKAAFNFYRYGYAAAFSTVIFLILLSFSSVLIKSTKAEEGVV